MAESATLATADGYIRVSKVAGREGESFIAPEVQRKKIHAWAELHDVEIVAWWEELDQSGKKRDRPMLQQALTRCEAGETGGIIVARLDRFARSAVDGDSARKPMCSRRVAGVASASAATEKSSHSTSPSDSNGSPGKASNRNVRP